jgi:hypothetical protein
VLVACCLLVVPLAWRLAGFRVDADLSRLNRASNALTRFHAGARKAFGEPNRLVSEIARQQADDAVVDAFVARLAARIVTWPDVLFVDGAADAMRPDGFPSTWNCGTWFLGRPRCWRLPGGSQTGSE